MEITYDPAKRKATLRDRGIDFQDATDVFARQHTVLVDDRFDYGESRYISAGYLRGRMVIVVWTQRGEARHVISMRKANEREQTRFREQLG